MSIEKRFIFDAHAVALAAHLRRPTDHFYKAVACSCLPPTGGLAEANITSQDKEGIVTFQSAITSARGDYTDTRRAVDFTNGNHGDNDLGAITFAECRVSGFRIAVPQDSTPGVAAKLRTFTADQLHVRLESTSDRKGQNIFRGLDAIYGGVAVDGHKLTVNTATEVCTAYETYDKLEQAYENDGKFRKQYGSQFFPTGNEKTGVTALLSHKMPNANGLVYCTVVKEIRWEGAPAPATKIDGNRLIVEGLGSIYFGEAFVEKQARRVTLIRFQLGSPIGGDGSVCDARTNGSTWPPTNNS